MDIPLTANYTHETYKMIVMHSYRRIIFLIEFPGGIYIVKDQGYKGSRL